jgi:threonine/homoserine/homoserine lactone efflux protein
LGLFGGLFLCYLGVRTLVNKPSEEGAAPGKSGSSSAYLTTLFLTLTNPMTILSFVAVFAGFGLGSSPDYFSAVTLVAGVFIGSAGWWLLLSSSVALLRHKLSLAWMSAVNRLSGTIILAFGIYALVTTARNL